MVTGNDHTRRDGKIEATEVRLDVKHVATEALPAYVGVGGSWGDF
jgi:hypothetical protein